MYHIGIMMAFEETKNGNCFLIIIISNNNKKIFGLNKWWAVNEN